ncbi:hypothetical protein ACIA8G_21265 [Lentzea sp. NPDC051213]|uniref:hypothetical protein n=1 Tax=Lentzea sp. NPDC051213 TaxID=3364126 RepID=UPI0037B984A2
MFKRALFVMPALGFGLAAIVGCSTVAPAPGAISTSTSSPASSSAVVEKPVTPEPVVKEPCAPAKDIQIDIAGAPSVVTPGKPVEVEVTLCNNTPVAYPEVGVVFGISRCTCAPGPLHMSRGTAQWFDTASGTWVDLKQPAVGTGMDYVSTFTNQQPLPKGKSLKVRYRFTLDRSMGAGEGGILAAAVVPAGLSLLGQEKVPFEVKP